MFILNLFIVKNVMGETKRNSQLTFNVKKEEVCNE